MYHLLTEYFRNVNMVRKQSKRINRRKREREREGEREGERERKREREREMVVKTLAVIGEQMN